MIEFNATGLNTPPTGFDPLQAPRTPDNLLSGFSSQFQGTLHNLIQSTPIEDRVAVFDLDHTLMNGNVGNTTFQYHLDCADITSKNLPPHLREVCGVQVSSSTNLSEFCQTFFEKLDLDIDPIDATRHLYRWMAGVHYSVSPAKVVEATAVTLSSRNRNSQKMIKPRRAMVDLISHLNEHHFDIWIVSANNPCGTRYAVSTVVNPMLLERGSKPIRMQNIVGMAPHLTDTLGQSYSDRELALEDNDYANLNRNRLQHLLFNEQLVEPTSCFEGKAQICREYLHCKPLLAAGDSFNDAAMLLEAQMMLWVDRGANSHDLQLLNEMTEEDDELFVENLR